MDLWAATIQLDLKIIILSEKSQTEKKYELWFYLHKILGKPIYSDRKQVSGFPGKDSRLARALRKLSGVMDMFIILTDSYFTSIYICRNIRLCTSCCLTYERHSLESELSQVNFPLKRKNNTLQRNKTEPILPTSYQTQHREQTKSY